MRNLKLLVTALMAVALLAIPGSAMAKSRDRDHDRMADKWEKRHHLNTHRRDGKLDPDRDGLSNLGEFRSRTNPHDADSDNDSIEDGDEDRDRDSVDNANEVREGTSPRDADSDDDGIRDGREDRDRDHLDNAGEDRTANDPVDADTDDDGVKDGEEVTGTITGFDSSTGALTIDMGPGRAPLTGTVTPSTEIECKTEDEHEDAEDDDGGDRSRALAARDGSDDGDRQGSGEDSRPGSTGEHDGDEDNRCTTADLTDGTRVHEAELENGQFKKLEILK